MLSRFWSYQQLLSSSLGISNSKESLKLPFFSIFVSILFICALFLIFGYEGILFYPLVLTLCSVYSIVNSKNKLFEIVPVSKIYSLISIYLYIFITSLYITIGTIIGFIIVTLPSAIVITPLLKSFTVGRLVGIQLNMLVTKFISFLNVDILLNNWRTLLVTGCIFTIIACISLPIFFIKINSIRQRLTISIIVLIPTLLFLFKSTLPIIVELGKVDFWKSISIMPRLNIFLVILLCVCVLLLPISMLISYKLYNGKRCLIC